MSCTSSTNLLKLLFKVLHMFKEDKFVSKSQKIKLIRYLKQVNVHLRINRNL